MITKFATALMAASMLAGVAAPAAAGQRNDREYQDGYRDGYDRGYEEGRRAAQDDLDRDRDRFRQPPPQAVPAPGAFNNNDRDQRWRQRYPQAASYNDDRYYSECRTQPDPAGVIAGALIGGLLGNAVGGRGSRGVATVGGVIAGGAIGAALTRNMTCEDRSYAYKTYSDGFSSGRPNSAYQWRNPNNGHYGTFQVGQYYNDPDNFRCATYTQQIFIEGRPQAASGRACQQPDGTWAIIQ